MNIIINSFKFLIDLFYGITGDFGIAIVLITIIVKLILLPFSIKQRIAMKKQINFSKKIEEVKNRYKNNKKKQEEEVRKLYSQSPKGLLGCLIPILQLPIISGLYMTINRLQVEAITILVPWAISIGNSDDKFVVPLLYTLITVAPSIISYFNIFGNDENHISIKSILPMIIFGLVMTIKAPIALGIYFITSSLFTLIEDIGFRLYSKNKVFV